MKNIQQAIKAFDDELISKNKRYLTLGQANKILIDKGILSSNDISKGTLKKILEEGKKLNAHQTTEKPRQWRIMLSEKGIRKKIISSEKKNNERIVSQKRITVPSQNHSQYKPIGKEEFKFPKDLKKWLIGIFGIFVIYTIATNDSNNSKVKNNPWDNSVHQVESYLKRNLSDPNSFEAIQWSDVYDMKHNQYGYRYKVRVKYRAKNSFGGYVIESDLFYLDENGRVVKVE